MSLSKTSVSDSQSDAYVDSSAPEDK